jgi:isopentenyl-diphosphate delta-isomerase
MSTDIEKVILVDSFDNEVGTMEKMDAHRFGGTLHRAFSVFVFNAAGEMLLQQRAISKYHSGGLYTNTCCSHPRPHEDISDAANRRLQEEMGMSCVLQKIFSFE